MQTFKPTKSFYRTFLEDENGVPQLTTYWKRVYSYRLTNNEAYTLNNFLVKSGKTQFDKHVLSMLDIETEEHDTVDITINTGLILTIDVYTPADSI